MRRFSVAIIFIAAMALSACLVGTRAEGAAKTVKGTVKDASGQMIAKATVLLVPASDVNALYRKPPFDIVRNSPSDEPMEDSLAANRDKYLKAMTDSKGVFSILQVPDGKYFVYVEPSDGGHLPGGDLSNKSMTAAELAAKPLAVMVSGKVKAEATFVGSSKCLTCHAEYASIKKTLHKLGIKKAGKASKLQDLSGSRISTPDSISSWQAQGSFSTASTRRAASTST